LSSKKQQTDLYSCLPIFSIARGGIQMTDPSKMIAYPIASRDTPVYIHKEIFGEAAVLYRCLTGRNESDPTRQEKKNVGAVVAALAALGQRSDTLLDAAVQYGDNPAVQTWMLLQIAKAFYGAEPGVPEKIVELDDIQKTLHLPDDLAQRL